MATTTNNNTSNGGGGGGGFFPFKVQDLVSVVTDAIDAFDASHDPIPREYRKKVVTASQQQKQQVKKTGEPGRPTQTKDVIMEDAPQQQQKQTQQQKSTPNNTSSNKKETSSNIVTPKKEEAPLIYTSGSKKVEPELVSDEEQQQQQQQPPPQHIVEFAKEVIEPKTLFFPTAADLHSESNNNSEQDWEILSEREHSTSHSYSNGSGGEIFVPRAGSIRSIASIDENTNNSSSQKDRSVPFKIQRTLSSSTIDSQDNILGPSGLGVLGVDYVEHIVLPTDTLQGICIAYKVSASSLRRANHFTGHKIHSAPKKLLIPLSKQALRTGFIRVQDTDSKEYKLHYFQAEFPNINMVEAKAYLELADWDLKEALQSAKADREWQKEEAADGDGDDFEKDDFKGGQIGVKINFRGSRPLMKLRGIGRAITSKTKKVMDQSASLSSNSTPANNSFLVDPDEEEIDLTSASEEDSETKSRRKSKQKVIVHSQLPPIATKSVFAEDLFNAAPEHCNYGLELKPIPKRQDNNSNDNN